MQPEQQPTSKPRFLSKSAIDQCMTFRDAVRLAYQNRVRQHMTQATFAEEIGAYAPHVSQWLHSEPIDKHGNKRADLPAALIPAVEKALGNHAISQFLTRQGLLHLMEEMAWAMSNT
ncbi:MULTISPECIES: hypothetical protein [unclassified Achromobacter]|uniref:hypothetical protein n=1 Tax=unclassified Achromobacter TaxID=2626865 RepID=UPI000B516B09|nr:MULTISPECIES: hypothetical protein [unclassified Achromobacter]OWT68067.1 hypothetical protein CEY05_28965 [Achromobacter sp. HZ34]OWT69904.1 hypothetical protein CEY04_27795 [Achromobacter sp. HZ28]